MMTRRLSIVTGLAASPACGPAAKARPRTTPYHSSAGQRFLSFGLVLLTAAAAQGQRPSAQPPCVIPQSKMISWWTGDTSDNDLYGVNNPSAENAVTLVPGEVLDGFTFGTEGYIDIPASPTLANQKFTWAAWAEPMGPGPNNDSYGSIIVGQQSGTGSVLQLNWDSPDERFLFVFGASSTAISSTDTFPPGSFYFVAATYDGKTFRLYVNGVLEGTYAQTGTIAYSSSTWTIGSADAEIRAIGYPRTWNGVIDEVQAYPAPLSASELLAIYKAGSAGVCKAAVILNPAKETFASEVVGVTSPAKTVTLINNRDVVLTIDGFTFAGADPSDFAVSSTTCGSTLAARKSCKVSLTFTPQATGKRSATLNVNDSDSSSPQPVALSGTGT
jgi:hypothetical protein